MERLFWWFGLAASVVSVFSSQFALGQATDHRTTKANLSPTAASQDSRRKSSVSGPKAIRLAMRQQVNSGLVSIIFAGMVQGDFIAAANLVPPVEDPGLKGV